MRRLFFLAVLTLIPALTSAADPPAAKPASPAKPAPKVAATPEFDFGFVDGSNVKVVVLEESLAVTTKYGVLTVPLTELRRVELGFRYPEGVEAKLKSAIGQLAAPAFAEREEATRQLYELKQFAGPMLARAAAEPDTERRQRAATLLDAIKKVVPAERIDAKDYDTIETAEFKIRGRIDAATVGVRTKQFGDAVVKLGELREMRAAAAPSPVGELTLDAATYSKMMWAAWLDTGIEVTTGEPLEITCTGTIDQWPQEAGKYTSGPAGNGNPAPNNRGNVRMFGPNGMMQQRMVPSGAVVGKIGDNGQPFVVGASLKLPKTTEAGKLFLQIAPSHWGNDNATGAYKVRVKTGE